MLLVACTLYKSKNQQEDKLGQFCPLKEVPRGSSFFVFIQKWGIEKYPLITKLIVAYKNVIMEMQEEIC